MEPEQAGTRLPRPSSPAEPPSAGGTHLTGHLSLTAAHCRLAAPTYLAESSEGWTLTAVPKRGAVGESSITFLFITSVPLVATGPDPTHPWRLIQRPHGVQCGELGFNCPGDASLSGNLIFVDLCFALKAWRDVCPSLALTSCMWPGAGGAAVPAGRKDTVVSSVWIASGP